MTLLTPDLVPPWPISQRDRRLLDHLRHLTEARTVEEVWHLHCDWMAGNGFPRLVYGFTRALQRDVLADGVDLMILSNFPAEYVAGYIDQGLFRHAPMVRWATANTGAMRWRWIRDEAEAGRLTEAEQRVLAHNIAHGAMAGYTISFPADVSSRFRAVIGLCAAPGASQDDMDQHWERCGQDILLANHVAHMRMICIPFNSGRPLTPRQREVLEWVGDGKTTEDIARIMGLTRPTVEKHLRLAREALGAGTTTQAVLKASFRNQIFTTAADLTRVWNP